MTEAKLFRNSGLSAANCDVATQAEKVGAPLSATSLDVTSTLPFFFEFGQRRIPDEAAVDVAAVDSSTTISGCGIAKT